MNKKDERIIKKDFIPFIMSMWHKNYYAQNEKIFYHGKKITLPCAVLIGPSKTDANKINIYTFDDNIGSGSYGEVYDSKHKFSVKPSWFGWLNILKKQRNEHNAKVIKVQYDNGHIENEVNLLKRIEGFKIRNNIIGPKILKFSPDYGEYTIEKNYLLMKKISGKTLEFIIEQSRENCLILSDTERLEITLALLAELKHLKDKKIIHRDIKPANIMVSLNPTKVKILDFGVSIDAADAINIKKLGGTMNYIAPETLKNKTAVSYQSDTLAMGLCIAELWGGNFNREYGFDYQQLIKDNKPLEPFKEDLSNSPTKDRMSEVNDKKDLLNIVIKDTINQMLNNDPAVRISSDAAYRIVSNLMTAFPNNEKKLILTAISKKNITDLIDRLTEEKPGFFSNSALKQEKIDGLNQILAKEQENTLTLDAINQLKKINPRLTQGMFSRTKKIIDRILCEQPASKI